MFVNWPMMHEAKVVGLSDAQGEYRLEAAPTNNGAKGAKGGGGGGGGGGAAADGGGEPTEVVVAVPHESEAAMKEWQFKAMDLTGSYLKGAGVPGSGGVDIGDVGLVLSVVALQGMRRDAATGALSKVFGIDEAMVPLQLALWSSPAPDPRFQEHGPLTLAELHEEGSKVMIVSPPPQKETKGKKKGKKGGAAAAAADDGKKDAAGLDAHLGQLATVVGVDAESKMVTVEVEERAAEPPFGLAIAQAVRDQYAAAHVCCKHLGLRGDVLGKVTGMMNVMVAEEHDRSGRNGEVFDLGLRLKLTTSDTRDKLRLLGFCRHSAYNDGVPNTGGGSAANCWEEKDTVKIVGSKLAGGAPPPTIGRATVKAEDWVCAKCKASVYGSKIACFKCNTPKPGHEAEVAAAEQQKEGEQLPPGGWEYSARAIQLVQEYRSRFPHVFTALRKHAESRNLTHRMLFPGTDAEARAGLQEVVDWLAGLPIASAPRAPLTTEALGVEAVSAIQKAADVRTAQRAKLERKFVTVTVPPERLCADQVSVSKGRPPPTAANCRQPPPSTPRYQPPLPITDRT